jgi:hypothetical protein
MDRKTELRPFANFLHEVVERLPGHRTAFAEKEVGNLGIGPLVTLAKPSTDGAKLVALHRLMGGQTSLLASDETPSRVKIEVLRQYYLDPPGPSTTQART